MATTLPMFAQQQLAARAAALASADLALTAAATAAQAAEAGQTSATAAAQAAGQAVEAVRKQLALAQTPAEVAALSLQLRTRTVAWRSALDAQAHQGLLRALAGAGHDSAKQRRLQAGAAHAASATALASAEARHQHERDLIDTALVQAPLKDVVARATSALASADFTAAKARIEGALPAALRERARARARQALAASQATQSWQDGAQAAFDVQAEASALAADQLARLQRGADAAAAALTVYAGTATARLASAVATLKTLAELTEPALNPAQQASLDDLQGGDRPAAAAAEQARDEAAAVLAAAAAHYRAERIQALATDPDGDLATMEADAATFPDLVQAKADFDDAVTEHGLRAADFDAGMALRLAEWQAEVPDALWSQAAAFHAADDALNELTTAPAALVSALDAANALWLAALEDDATRQRRVEHTAATLDHERARRAAVQRLAGERGATALRGSLAVAALLQP